MATKKVKKRAERDVNANVHRIFGEIIERSEQPPNRGNLGIAQKRPAEGVAQKRPAEGIAKKRPAKGVMQKPKKAR
jgi:hypothetical protein